MGELLEAALVYPSLFQDIIWTCDCLEKILSSNVRCNPLIKIYLLPALLPSGCTVVSTEIQQDQIHAVKGVRREILVFVRSYTD